MISEDLAENPHFDGFLLHTLKTMGKVLRYLTVCNSGQLEVRRD